MTADPNNPFHWRDMADAPHDGTEIVLRMPRKTMNDHYCQYGRWLKDDAAHGLHPPLNGWFRCTEHGFEDLHEPAGWRPVVIVDRVKIERALSGILASYRYEHVTQIANELGRMMLWPVSPNATEMGRRLRDLAVIPTSILYSARGTLLYAADMMDPNGANSADSDAVAKETGEEVERYIATCIELSDKGRYEWWSKLAMILATVRLPDGWTLAPAEPTLEMVLAGENAHDDQLCKRLDDKNRQPWPSEETTELATRVSYRAMMGARPPLPKPGARRPIPPVGAWEIDQSTGSDILVFEKCSVIEGPTAHLLLDLVKREFYPAQFETC